MKPLTVEVLQRLSVVRYYEAAFRKATGVPLHVVPPDAGGESIGLKCAENSFCALVGTIPQGCLECQQTEARARRSAARKLSTQQIYCFAGLTVVAMPVVIDGQHVATLMSGQVFRREPTERDFQMVLKMLGPGLETNWESKARRAYFQTPVITADRFQAVLQLLSVFAQYLADFGSRAAVANAHSEPKAVAGAKEFIESHMEEPITLDRVVEHVHVSRFYFCKLFKKATGMTLTEYVARVRVEKAKTLLVDPSRRISEVVYAAGFGSIPQFNTIFKRYVGMPPTEYRATLKDH